MADTFLPKLINRSYTGVGDYWAQSTGGDPNRYLEVKFQDGPYRGAYGKRNGACIEDLLIVAYARLKGYQAQFPCEENAEALKKIKEAVMWLDARTIDRDYRGVLGEEKA